jgi:outer membrane protein insertion porin family
MNSKIVALIIILLLSSPFALAKRFSYRRQVINKIELTGNRHFSDGQLKDLLLTKVNHWYNFLSKKRLSRPNVNTDQEQIRRFYGQHGYLFADVQSVADYYKNDSTKAVVKFNISEGEIVYLDSIRMVGGLASINSRMTNLFEKLMPVKPINNDAVLGAALRIRDFYADNSYPLVSVKPSYQYSGDSTKATAVYQIAESCFVYNGSISIAQDGGPKTKEYVIRRELLVKPGEPFNRKKTVESQQRLYSTGLFKFIDLKRSGEITYTKSDTAVANLQIKASARKAKFVNFRIGLGQQLYFNSLLSVLQSSFSIGTRNLWGTGRKLIFEVKNSLQLAKKNETMRVLKFKDLFSNLHFKPISNSIGINYIEPWFLRRRLPLSFNVVFEPGTKNPIINRYYDKLSQEASIVWNLDKFTSTKFSQRVEFVNIHGAKNQEAALLRIEGQNSVRRRLAVYGQRDARDNIFLPQKGSYSYLSVDYVGHILGGDFNFLKTEFSWSRYRILIGENILATRFRFGILEELGSNGRSSTEDRFTLGGAKSVRGFAENSLGPKWVAGDSVTSDLLNKPKGGKVLLLANAEIRRSLFWRFGGTVYIDAGNVLWKLSDFRTRNIISSAGLGLQFFTPVGPINFEYAFMLQKQLDLREGSYHLTILYAF